MAVAPQLRVVDFGGGRGGEESQEDTSDMSGLRQDSNYKLNLDANRCNQKARR